MAEHRTKPLPFSGVFHSPDEAATVSRYVTNEDTASEEHAHITCTRALQHELQREHLILTGSCSQALELAALLLDTKPGDEIILPSFTFPSTANAFVLRGATIKFADSQPHSPNIAPAEIRRHLSSRTKAVVVMHYGGVACDLSEIGELLKGKEIALIEDAAHCLGASYQRQPLGTFGSFGAFSFHKTKNLSCEHGGALVFPGKDAERAEAISSKGTNQLAVKRKHLPFYEWVEIGSAPRMSGFHATLLSARLPHLAAITERRVALWNRYYENLKPLADAEMLTLPSVPHDADHNAHIFFVTARDPKEAAQLLSHLTQNGIEACTHYVPLHMSSYGRRLHTGESLPHAERFASCLIRLPLWHGLENRDIDHVSAVLETFFTRGASLCSTRP